MQQWHLIKSTNSLPEASILQGMLEENNIPVQLLNKLDSSYQIFGEIEIYVPLHLKNVAVDLLNKTLLN